MLTPLLSAEQFVFALRATSQLNEPRADGSKFTERQL